MKSMMKPTVIGEIPEDWEIVKLGELFQRVTRKNTEGNTNALTISAQMGLISQTEFFNKTVASSNLSGYYLLHNGDFAYNKSYSKGYPMGVIKRLDRYDKGVVSTLYICFGLINKYIDSSFYTQYFEAGYFNDQLASIAQEGARAHGLLNVGVKDFFNLLVVKPPLLEQQKIAEILSTVDEKMAVIDEQLAQTQELKKGLMQRMLTKGIGHTEFKDSPLGQIPESWESMEFGLNLDVTSGYGFKLSEYSKQGFKLLRIDNVSHGKIIWNDIVYLPFDYEGKYKNIVLKEGDILLALNRPITQGKLKIAKMTQADLPSILYQRVGRIDITSPSYEKSFVFFLLSFFLKPFIEQTSVGSDQPFIKLTTLRKLKLPVPPLPEQRQIAEILVTVDEKLQVLTDKKAKYQELKRGLMQQLLTGQRRVRVAAELATA